MDEKDGRPEGDGWPRRLQAYERAIVIADDTVGAFMAALLSDYFEEVVVVDAAERPPICLDACGERVIGVQAGEEGMLPASLVIVLDCEAAGSEGPEGLLVARDGMPLPEILRALKECLDEQRRRYGRNHLYGMAERFKRRLVGEEVEYETLPGELDKLSKEGG
jgi:hypothetical protein